MDNLSGYLSKLFNSEGNLSLEDILLLIIKDFKMEEIIENVKVAKISHNKSILYNEDIKSITINEDYINYKYSSNRSLVNHLFRQDKINHDKNHLFDLHENQNNYRFNLQEEKMYYYINAVYIFAEILINLKIKYSEDKLNKELKYLKKLKPNYQYNQINPQKRYAKIKALYYVNEIFSIIPNNSKTLKKFIETNKELITDGYKDKDTSFLDNYYNAKIDPTIELAKINLNFKTRYLLGLPVDICDKKRIQKLEF